MRYKIIPLLLVFLLFTPIALAITEGDIMGSSCEDAYIFEPGDYTKCQKETEFNSWSELKGKYRAGAKKLDSMDPLVGLLWKIDSEKNGKLETSEK